MDPLWTRCCVAGADGLCGKQVRDPMPGFLGMCDEHRAHGVNCWCGHFFLPSHRPGRVVDMGGKVHTAFACGAADESAHNDTKGGDRG